MIAQTVPLTDLLNNVSVLVVITVPGLAAYFPYKHFSRSPVKHNQNFILLFGTVAALLSIGLSLTVIVNILRYSPPENILSTSRAALSWIGFFIIIHVLFSVSIGSIAGWLRNQARSTRLSKNDSWEEFVQRYVEPATEDDAQLDVTIKTTGGDLFVGRVDFIDAAGPSPGVILTDIQEPEFLQTNRSRTDEDIPPGTYLPQQKIEYMSVVERDLFNGDRVTLSDSGYPEEAETEPK